MQVRQGCSKALAYCHKHMCGARKAINALKLTLVKRGQLQNFVKEGLHEMPEDQRAILTMDEELQLANLVRQSAIANKSMHRKALEQKIIKILEFRRVTNIKMKHGRKHVKFSPAAANVLKTRTVDPRFFASFYARHDPFIREVIPREEEFARELGSSEEAIDIHFNGVHGVVATLKEAGLLSDDGTITDPSRVLNFDEVPQFISYNMNKGNTKLKYGGVPTQMHRVQVSKPQNRARRMRWA